MEITKQSVIGDVLDFAPETAEFFLRSVCIVSDAPCQEAKQ